MLEVLLTLMLHTMDEHADYFNSGDIHCAEILSKYHPDLVNEYEARFN